MVVRVVIWEDGAKTQLKKLYQYIRQHSLQNAIAVRNDIIEKVKYAAIHPESYEIDKYRIDNDGSIRAFELHHYRVSYQFTDKELVVIRLRHTAQSPLEY